MGGRGLLKMVVALLAVIFGAMIAVGDGPEVAMGSDEPGLTADERAALEISDIEVSKSDETPVILASAGADTAMDAAETSALVEAALSEELAPEPEQIAAAPAAPKKTYGVVQASRVNVRAGPSTAYQVIGKVVRDQEVEVIEIQGNGWVRIMVDGREGYMSGDFLETRTQG